MPRPASRQAFTPTRLDRNSDIELPASADALPDSVTIDLDNKDPDAFEILEIDDTPEADRDRPTSYAPEDETEANRHDPASRIKRMTFERETERRRAEAAERERDAAVQLAREQAAEVEELRSRLGRSTEALGNSMVERNKSAMAEARNKLSKAHEEGNSEAIADAQIEISRLATEEMAIKTNLRAAPPQQERAPQQTQQTQQPPTMAPRVAAWIAKNSWFGKPGHEDRTELAMGVHRGLLAKGIQPSDPRYTQELDQKLQAVYKDHQPFEETERPNPAPRREAQRPNANAEGGRENSQTPAGDRRTVTLTRSELSIAKRLGVTPQAYARSKMEREARNGDGA